MTDRKWQIRASEQSFGFGCWHYLHAKCSSERRFQCGERHFAIALGKMRIADV